MKKSWWASVLWVLVLRASNEAGLRSCPPADVNNKKHIKQHFLSFRNDNDNENENETIPSFIRTAAHTNTHKTHTHGQSTQKVCYSCSCSCWGCLLRRFDTWAAAILRERERGAERGSCCGHGPLTEMHFALKWTLDFAMQFIITSATDDHSKERRI